MSTYWEIRGIGPGRFYSVDHVLAEANLNDEEAVRRLGYDEFMRLPDLSLEAKGKLGALLDWSVPSYAQVYKAWKEAGLSTRIANIFATEGIIDEIGLRRYKRYELMRMPNLGKQAADQIEAWLERGAPQSPELVIERPPLASFSDAELLAELAERLQRRKSTA